MRDERDLPQTEIDPFGNLYFITSNGTKIKVRDQKEAETLQILEDDMNFYQRFPMGMK